jgi:hypothetical protein
MKEHDPHKYFNTKKDYTKWDNFVMQIDSIDLSKEDKERGRAAIRYLETILGKHFLSDIIQFGHPLLSYFFINSANLARIQLIDFAESLQALEKSLNFHTVINKIKKARKFSEGSTILESAHRFHKVGFSIAFDLKVSFTDGAKLKTKEPDIKIVNDDSEEEIYVEVSETGRSQAELDNSRTYQYLFMFIHNIIFSDPEMTDLANPSHILPHVKILRSMSEEELIEVSSRIEKVVEKVRKSGEFQEMIIGDMVEIAISPFDDHSKAEEWAKERNITDFVENCFFYPNELRRVINRLNEELEQLPIDKPGIVVLWNNANLLFYLHRLTEIINEVANKIATHPNVYGVALNHDFGWAEPRTGFIEIEDHLLVSNTGRDLINRNTLLVRNRFFNLPITAETEEKLVKSFVNSSARD